MCLNSRINPAGHNEEKQYTPSPISLQDQQQTKGYQKCWYQFVLAEEFSNLEFVLPPNQDKVYHPEEVLQIKLVLLRYA